MDFNKFTEKSQEAVGQAQTIASRRGHQQVDVEHLLLAVLEQTEGIAPALLERAGVAISAVKSAAEQALAKVPQVQGPGAAPGQIHLTARLSQVLTKAEQASNRTMMICCSGCSGERLVLEAIQPQAGGGRAWWRWLLAACFVGLGLSLGPLLQRPAVGQWLRAWASFLVAGAGLVWWLVAPLGWLGWGLVAAAIWNWIGKPRRAAPVLSPSTIRRMAPRDSKFTGQTPV